MFIIGSLPVAGPLIFPIKQLYQSLGKHFLQISQQDNIVLTMIVDPALITFLGVLALNFARIP
jgi:hypothetical protein